MGGIMYKIEKTSYGYKITFSDFISAEELTKWLAESKSLLATQSSKFQNFIDMRALKPLPQDAQPIMEEGQKLYKSKGMEKSVVILSNSITTMQFKRIAKETGIYAFERYIDSSATPNWEQKGIDWLTKGIDPDK